MVCSHNSHGVWLFFIKQSSLKRLNERSKYEQGHEKTCLPGFQPGPTQTKLYSNRRLLEAWNFGFRE